MLPILNYLTTLKLTFDNDMGIYNNKYCYDERTFESIHQPCPVMECLLMKHIDMNISEDYDKILTKLLNERSTINKNTTSPSSPCNQAQHPKIFNISGTLHGPGCYSYFLYKYLRIEILTLLL
ncbi:unnamed protein product [Cunninghamella blakesleeana]